MRTVTAGLIATPAVALVGCWAKASLFAVAAVMLKLEEVAPINAPLLAVNV